MFSFTSNVPQPPVSTASMTQLQSTPSFQFGNIGTTTNMASNQQSRIGGGATGVPLFYGSSQPATSVPVAVSFAAHPFQYIQQCFDPANPNYRFRV
jgi:hypothetical protein